MSVLSLIAASCDAIARKACVILSQQCIHVPPQFFVFQARDVDGWVDSSFSHVLAEPVRVRSDWSPGRRTRRTATDITATHDVLLEIGLLPA